jgi:hypothetical protein
MMNNLRELMVTTGKLAARAVAVALISLPAGPTALAGDDSQLSLSLGIFVTDWNSETRLDVSAGRMGTPVDLERDLGVDTSDSVFRIDGYYRVNDKHRIDFSAFDLSRTGNKQIEKEIDWQGTIFPISASVNSDIDLNIYKIAYTYSILRREKGYLGLSAGFYIADVGARISAENIANREGGDATTPFPVVGLRGEYQFTEKWSFRASGEFFALEYQDFDGSLIDLYAGIDYQLSEHVAIGLGVNSVSIDVEISGNDLNGNLDWRYGGGLLFFKFDF